MSRISPLSEFNEHILETLSNDSNFQELAIPRDESLKFMKKLYSAIISNKKVTIVGDYDVDGFFSAIELETHLKVLENRIFEKAIDSSNIQILYSDRSDGYTLPENKFKELKKNGVVVFLDTGSSYPYLNDEELDGVYIIDHHPEKQDGYSRHPNIFNPNLNGNLSTSTGRIVYEMVNVFEEELEKYCKERDISFKKHNALSYIKALAGVTLVSDMANIDEEQNRRFVRESLEFLSNNKKNFLWLKDIKNRDVTSSDLSFSLINHINSISRLGHNLEKIVDLYRVGIKGEKMVRTTSSEKAKGIFEWMKDVHALRKQITSDLEAKVDSAINNDFTANSKQLLLVKIDNNYSGINGLLSQHILNMRGKPNIVLSYDKNRECYVGSGRGYGVKEILAKLLSDSGLAEGDVQFGGHHMAIGVSVAKEQIDKFLSLAQKTIGSKIELQSNRENVPERFYAASNIAEFKEACSSYEHFTQTTKISSRFYAVIDNYTQNGIVQKKNGWNYALLTDNSGAVSVFFKESDAGKILNQEPLCLEIDNSSGLGVGTFFIQNKPIPMSESLMEQALYDKKEEEQAEEQNQDFQRMQR